jgi:pimeloyl-ACP methyl ester carboxylesterase
MKNIFIIISAFFLIQQTFSQDALNRIKYGSNLENGKYATIDGIKIYYETYGQGTPLLLLHGGLGSIAHFEYNIERLASENLVIAVDSPGHGRSSHTDSLSYPLLSDYISKFIDYMELDSLNVMGWSDGGVIGLILAANRPDKVKKLLAIGANSRLDGMNPDIIEWIKNDMIIYMNSDQGFLENYESLSPQPDKLGSFLMNSQKMWLSATYVSLNQLKSIDIPTMLLQGDRDLIKIEHVTEMYRSLANSELCILPNASHYVLHEKPAIVNQIALDFFNSKKE